MHAGSRCRIYAMHSTTMKVFPPFHVTCTIKSHGSVGRGPILPIVIHLEAMQLNLNNLELVNLCRLVKYCPPAIFSKLFENIQFASDFDPNFRSEIQEMYETYSFL